jgi:hypothetical protein
VPYIPQHRRIEALILPEGAGELCYALTDTCIDFLPPDPSFADFAQVIAALETTKLEFYRRMIAPYEDDKRLENGDVFDGA